MIRFGTDENFKKSIANGLIRLRPSLDIISVKEYGLLGAPDPKILAWAAEQGRVLLTHDAKTMPIHAGERLHAGLRMAGLIVVPELSQIGVAIETLLLIVDECEEGDLEGNIRRLPR